MADFPTVHFEIESDYPVDLDHHVRLLHIGFNLLQLLFTLIIFLRIGSIIGELEPIMLKIGQLLKFPDGSRDDSVDIALNAQRQQLGAAVHH